MRAFLTEILQLITQISSSLLQARYPFILFAFALKPTVYPFFRPQIIPIAQRADIADYLFIYLRVFITHEAAKTRASKDTEVNTLPQSTSRNTAPIQPSERKEIERKH